MRNLSPIRLLIFGCLLSPVCLMAQVASTRYPHARKANLSTARSPDRFDALMADTLRFATQYEPTRSAPAEMSSETGNVPEMERPDPEPIPASSLIYRVSFHQPTRSVSLLRKQTARRVSRSQYPVNAPDPDQSELERLLNRKKSFR